MPPCVVRVDIIPKHKLGYVDMTGRLKGQPCSLTETMIANRLPGKSWDKWANLELVPPRTASLPK